MALLLAHVLGGAGWLAAVGGVLLLVGLMIVCGFGFPVSFLLKLPGWIRTSVAPMFIVGGAAVVLTSLEFARKHTAKPVRVAAISTVTPRYPNTVIEMPNFATDSAVGVAVPDVPFRDSIARGAYEQAGIGPEDVSLAEVYDLSTALELDWYENIGLCKPGDAEKLLRDGVTTLGGKQPVNASGGLGCFVPSHLRLATKVRDHGFGHLDWGEGRASVVQMGNLCSTRGVTSGTVDVEHGHS